MQNSKIPLTNSKYIFYMLPPASATSKIVLRCDKDADLRKGLSYIILGSEIKAFAYILMPHFPD